MKIKSITITNKPKPMSILKQTRKIGQTKEKSKSTISFAIDAELKKLIEKRCKHKGKDVSEYLSELFEICMSEPLPKTKNQILSDFKIFANHNLLSLALTINKVDYSIKNKIIEDYESIISFFNDKEFNDNNYSNWDDAFLSSSYGGGVGSMAGIKQNEGKLFNEKGEMLVYKKQSDTSSIYDVDVYEPRKTDVEEYSKFKYCKREKNGRECVYRLDKKALIEMIKKEKFIYSNGGGVDNEFILTSYSKNEDVIYAKRKEGNEAKDYQNKPKRGRPKKVKQK